MIKTFYPGSGDLLFRGPLAEKPDGIGLPVTSRYAWPTKSDGSSTAKSFPSRSSRNPFFARNNPHPCRVRHIKGLLDVPICTILDADHGESRSSQASRFSLTTPAIDQMRQRPLEGILKLPVNINSYRVREKAIPMMGMVPIVSDWKEELHRMTEAAGLSATNSTRNQLANNKGAPPSRQGGRQSSRQASRNSLRQMENEFVRNVASRSTSRAVADNGKDGATDKHNLAANGQNDDRPMEHIVAFPDREKYIFQLLGSILQTDSIQGIQNWLINAPDREKEIVLDMIRAVSSSDQEYREGINNIHSPRDIAKIEPIYEDQFLQHESSLETENIKKYNDARRIIEKAQKKKEINTTKSIFETLDEAVEQSRPGTQSKRKTTDYEWSVEANKPSSPFHMFGKQNTRPGTAQAEIEDIRNKLASRSSAKVFDHQSRPGSRPTTQQNKSRGGRNSNHPSPKSKTVQIITPFKEE